MRRSFCFSRSCSPYSDKRCLRSLFTPPGGTSSLHFDSSGLTPLLRNRSVPSRRESLHFGPVYFAIANLLNATLFGRTAAVMRNRRDVFNVGDLQTAAVQGPHRRFASRARAHHAHFDVLHTVFLRCRAGTFRRDLRRERRRLAPTAVAATTRCRPGQRVALPIGDRDDGVVEGSMHVRNRVQHVLAYFLACRFAALRGRRGLLRILFRISQLINFLGANFHALRATIDGGGAAPQEK